MLLVEAWDLYESEVNICVVIKGRSGELALTHYNFSGGMCDCCRDYDVDGKCEVVRIVNMSTMETLYEV